MNLDKAIVVAQLGDLGRLVELEAVETILTRDGPLCCFCWNRHTCFRRQNRRWIKMILRAGTLLRTIMDRK